MKCAILFLLAFVGCVEGAKWALLVAGSNGYGNYRHQADVSHSYQLLIKRGIPASHIVTMMYDDVAYNSRNPFKGNIINKPGGPNVYAGVKVDYRFGDVTPFNFLNVLRGLSEKMKGIGTGRVIQSGPKDHIFVYYADHGNKGIIGFPGSAGVLSAKLLDMAIRIMYLGNQYEHMVFYIEACFSGSMFLNYLPSNRRVYAITAANEKESSYSCYYDKARKTYLGDEFSVQWMHDSERHRSGRSLNRQYRMVMLSVQGSHVMQYGDVSGMGEKEIGDFQGAALTSAHEYMTADLPPITDAVPTWDVPYMSLLHQLEDATTTEARLALVQEMQEEQSVQLKIRESMESIVAKLDSNPAFMMQVQDTDPSMEVMDCYAQTLNKYLKSCESFTTHDYAMKDLHVFANLCTKGLTVGKINQAVHQVCQ